MQPLYDVAELTVYALLRYVLSCNRKVAVIAVQSNISLGCSALIKLATSIHQFELNRQASNFIPQCKVHVYSAQLFSNNLEGQEME